MWSLLGWPKVITLSGGYCIWNLVSNFLIAILDVRACVKSYAAEKSRERSEGKKIRVAIPDDVPVSVGGSYSASSDPDGGGGDLVLIYHFFHIIKYCFRNGDYRSKFGLLWRCFTEILWFVHLSFLMLKKKILALLWQNFSKILAVKKYF